MDLNLGSVLFPHILTLRHRFLNRLDIRLAAFVSDIIREMTCLLPIHDYNDTIMLQSALDAVLVSS